MNKIKFLLQQKRPLRFLLGYFLWKTGYCRFFYIKYDNYKLKFFKSSLSMHSFIEKNQPNDEIEFIKNYLNPGDSFADIGANIGTMTIPAAIAVQNKGIVYCFEPHPVTFSYLTHNIKLNKLENITAYNKAVGDVKANLSFTTSLDTMNKIDIDNSSSNVIEVASVLLDEILPSSLKGLDLLKVDVEGFEFFVFKGAFKTLQNTKCIFFEFDTNNYTNFNVKLSDVVILLINSGFKLYSKEGSTISEFVFKKDKIYSTNLIAIKEIDDFILRTSYALN